MNDPGNAKTLVEEKERVSLGKSDDTALALGPLEPRYREVAPLGEGGMGEVRLVRDAVVGRDVAMKRVLSPMDRDEYARSRFLREARVQGQLEHPSIVPVYDLAMTPDSRIFFTMRRVRGRTLDDCANGTPKLTRHAILTAMSRVCLAVDFAHSRGVVHRDIKPGNIMLGDYGEVYLLDWGLAKLTGATDMEVTGMSDANAKRGSGKTTVGSVLGTPGYMAPEQARGEEIDERADVYALGACLFEVLAGIPLFETGTMPAMLAATVTGANAHISERAPERDVPVELESICVRATQTNRADRFESARAMSEAIERFLEGDRDLERRRTRAREHATAAANLTTKALASADNTARRDAMREVGHALANDPDNADARAALVRLLTEPARTPPPEVQAQIDAEREASIQGARRLVALAFLSTLVPNTIVVWMGLRSWTWFAMGGAAALLGAVAGGVPSHLFRRERRILVGLIAAFGILVASRVASPLIVAPLLAFCLGAGLALFPRKTSVANALLATVFCTAMPFVAEWLGWIAPTFHVTGDTLVIDGQFAHLSDTKLVVWFFVATMLPVSATCVYLGHIRDRLTAAEQHLRVQAWQLRQLIA